MWRGWPCGSDALTIHGAKVSALTWFVVILPAFRLYGLGVHHTFHRNLEPSILIPPDTAAFLTQKPLQTPTNAIFHFTDTMDTGSGSQHAIISQDGFWS